MTTPSPPKTDEVEVSVFGRGYGEAICVHLGAGEWMLVDSCMSPTRGTAAGLAYLDALGVAHSQVRIVVATHWHDDHVKGFASIVEACTDATVVCSAALMRTEVFAFVVRQEAASGVLGSGLDELRRTLRTCTSRKKPIVWAKANLALHPRPPGNHPKVVSLAPSDDACERSMVSLIEAAERAKMSIPRRYRAPEGPNGASVVLSVEVGDTSLLLGGDLENSSNVETGWPAVVSYAKPERKASAVKIPHHGSSNAHYDAMWSDLLYPDPLAILTPWIKGKKHLPTSNDLSRLSALSKSLYLTANPSSVIKKRKADKLVGKRHDSPITELRGWGHVRARRCASDASWRVDLFGDAVKN